MADESKEYLESLRKAKDVLSKVLDSTDELASTTSAVNQALARFSNSLRPAAERAGEARQALSEQIIASRRLKSSLGVYANTLGGIIAVGKEEIAVAKKKAEFYKAELDVAKAALQAQQKLSDGYRRGKERVESEIGVREAIVASLNRQIDSIHKETQASVQRTEALSDQRSTLQAEQDVSASRLSVIQVSIPELQAEIAAGQEANKTSKQKIKRLNSLDASYASEISELNKALTAIRTKNKTGKKLSDAEQSRVAELEQMKAAAQANRAKNQATVDAEIASRQQVSQYMGSLSQQIGQLQEEQNQILQRSPELASELEKNAEALANESFNRADMANKLSALESERAKEKSSISRLNNLSDRYSNELEGSIAAESELQKAVDDRAKKLATAKEEELNKKVDLIKASFAKVGDNLGKVANALNSLVATIRAMQREFGLSAGSAAKLKFENLVASVKSYTNTFLTLGRQAAVSAKEIEDAQKAFQSEFGGVLTSQAATDIARQAKEMGVGAGELAKARRVFMTQTMGNVGAAKTQTDKFIGEFTKKGLTAKDAMAAIQQNSELLARNGTRFSTSFARAAADAKKIGVDLSKIDQVGDNIIGDFEGFLEKSAELGAMGFGFDTSRLAEIAETGDTGALMGELRSQLAATGKDITKLRRSEQLALSQAFGLSMEELQRMAAPTAGAGEKTLSPEELQKESNTLLTRLINLTEGIGITLGIISATVLAISKSDLFSTAAKSLMGGSRPSVLGNLRSGAASAGRALVRPVSRAVRVGGSVLAGAIGGYEGFTGAKEAGKGTYEASGNAMVQGAIAATGAALGAFGGPLGMMVGGWLGNTIGGAVNKYFPEFGQIIGEQFKSIVEFAQPLIDSLKQVWQTIKDFGESIISVVGPVLIPGLKFVGFLLGATLVGAIELLSWALKPLIMAFTTAVDIVNLVIQGWTNLFGVIGSAIQGLSNILSNVPFIGEFFTKKGDDVYSKAGYGERSLVTPQGVIALNNNDNVVAYADDMIAQNAGINLLSKGAITRAAPPAAGVDFTRLENKLDQVITAIGSMKVEMDGTKVGKVVVTSDQKAALAGVFRAQRV